MTSPSTTPPDELPKHVWVILMRKKVGHFWSKWTPYMLCNGPKSGRDSSWNSKTMQWRTVRYVR
jgi:hypothetical protein